jgi:hypothetical protein
MITSQSRPLRHDRRPALTWINRFPREPVDKREHAALLALPRRHGIAGISGREGRSDKNGMLKGKSLLVVWLGKFNRLDQATVNTAERVDLLCGLYSRKVCDDPC